MSEKKNWFKDIPFFQKRKYYEPWYDDKQDFNTNSKSYYDYLARFNHLIRTIVDHINRSLDRDLRFNNTESVTFKKDGEWIESGECQEYDDLMQIKADVNISKQTTNGSLKNTPQKKFTLNNSIHIKSDGLYSPDYVNMLNSLDDGVGKNSQDIQTLVTYISDLEQTIETRFLEVEEENKKLRQALQKIVTNLNQGGAITTSNVDTFNFVSGRRIASGNINLFGGISDGDSFIRTSNNKQNNDISAGY